MTINITPETFGNVAAEGMRYGFDVSAYLIRRAMRQLPTATPPAPAPAAVLPTQHPAATPTPAPATGFIPAPPVPGLEPVDGPPDFSALTSAMHHKL